jgi:hypothetical protein
MAGAAGACAAPLFPIAANVATTVVKTKSNLAEAAWSAYTLEATSREDKKKENPCNLPFEGGKHIPRRGGVARARVPAAPPDIAQAGSEGDEAGEPEDHGDGLDGDDGEAVGGDGQDDGGDEEVGQGEEGPNGGEDEEGDLGGDSVEDEEIVPGICGWRGQLGLDLKAGGGDIL